MSTTNHRGNDTSLRSSKAGSRSLTRGTAIVVASTGGAFAARWAIDPVIHERMPYILFLGAVAASTRWAGWRFGSAAAALSTLVATHFFAEPKGKPWLDNLTDATSAVLFLAVSAIIIVTMAEETAARRRVEERDAELRHQLEERERLQIELEASRRLESIGRLAGGIAHDFNNLLTVIVGSAELLTRGAGQDELVEGIQLAAHRGADLTKQLLSFARKQMLRLTHMNINDAVAESMKLVERLIPEDVRIIVETCKSPWQFEGDSTQIQQVLLNLITNARDALPKGGTIRIVTNNVTLDEQFARLCPEVTPGEYVLLSVVDDGFGMSDELRSRIFEPFFTTKAAGTGLGLAVSYGIVKQLRGHIVVRSETDRGTRFDVYWPRAQVAATEPKAPEPKALLSPHQMSILFVEDDCLVRKITAKMLQKLGHRVFLADSGASAIEIAKTSEHIELLVTDVVMPSINGRELYELLVAKLPDLKVVYISGYTDNVILKKGVINPDVTLVRKPFTAVELEAAIQTVTCARKLAG